MEKETAKKVTLTINGTQQTVMAEPDKVLLDLLRQDMKLTGTKQSCDRKGQCGACTVIVDGKTVRSCLKKVTELEGASVITVEGLGSPENPHLIQEAFVLSGAIQCGFCTPGMIMATKALLDKDRNPDVATIKKAFARNLCRCTGYQKIIDAVNLSARFLRNETTPEEVRKDLGDSMIGVSHPRPTSMLKACGLAKFTGDIDVPNAVELALVHSTEFHADIKSVDTSEAEKMPGVIGVMTGKDVQGTNRIRVIFPDQPVLCDERVKILGDPIAAVAAETREQARAAAAAVKVAYDPLPVALTPEEALAEGFPQIHAHGPNTCFSMPLIKGDAKSGLAGAKTVVEAEFSTQMNHQAPMEPEACVSYLEGEGEDQQLVVIGRSINIHAHAAQIKEAVGFEKIRYKEAFSGGQFGIKAAVTTEAVTAAAAMHFKRPIRYTPSYEESMLITSKRHPYKMSVKIGADDQGRIISYINDFTINKGAYTILGPMAIMRSLQMLSGAYFIPNIFANGKLVYTNNGYGGAARGAGPPQTLFALETAVDMLAEKVGVDPLEFRKLNSLTPGQTKSTGMVAEQWPFPKLCEAFLPYYEKAKKAAADFNSQGGTVKRGVGIAAVAFGIGGAGDRANLAVEVDEDDGITIYAAVADPGEGNESMLSQIAADALDMPLDKIRLYTRDTEKTVGMGPAAGSRMTWMAGGALVDATSKLKAAFEEVGEHTHAALTKAGKPTRYEGERKVPRNTKFDFSTGQGDAFVSECHNIQMAEVEVDTTTGAARVLKMTSIVDPGRVINPLNLEGQVEGGMDQGVGYALREEFVIGKSKDFVTFKYPTMGTAFDVELVTLETPRNDGPVGATGIGEMTMTSTAPAVINGIYNACGVRIQDLPATPDKIKAALEKA